MKQDGYQVVFGEAGPLLLDYWYGIDELVRSFTPHPSDEAY